MTERVGACIETVDAELAGQRIDNFLMSRLKGVPRSRIYRSIRGGEVRVNGGRIRQTYRLVAGDQVRLPPIGGPPRQAPQVPGSLTEDLRGRVLHEDPWLLVFDKPSGMAVHGGSGLRLGLIESLRADSQRRGDIELVHRLDRDTSGCLLIAKRRSALRALHEALRQHTVAKDYLALVHGHLRRSLDVDDALLRGTNSSGERVVRASSEGKPSMTRFVPLRRTAKGSSLPAFTLVRASPRTGRTHQIRVHGERAGHALAGDAKYAGREQLRVTQQLGLRRLFLHAHSLEFEHPNGRGRLRVEAPLPAALGRFLADLGIDPTGL